MLASTTLRDGSELVTVLSHEARSMRDAIAEILDTC